MRLAIITLFIRVIGTLTSLRSCKGGTMFWACTFFVVGGTAVAVCTRTIPPLPVAGLVLVSGVLVGLYWAGDASGFHDLVIGSWKILSGVDSPGGIVQECYGTSIFERSWWRGLLGLGLAFFNIIPGLVGIFATPVGVVVTLVGAVTALFNPKSELLGTGLTVLGVGVAGVVTAGIVMRLMHWTSGYGC